MSNPQPYVKAFDLPAQPEDGTPALFTLQGPVTIEVRGDDTSLTRDVRDRIMHFLNAKLTTQCCGVCGKVWDGNLCAHRHANWPFPLCYPTAHPVMSLQANELKR